MDGQDWAPVKITSTATSAHQQSKAPRVSNEARHAAAIADATEPGKIKYLTAEAVATIQGYRRENKLTQKQLDQMLAFPPNTINRLEARHESPSSRVLQSLNRLLKAGLTLG